MSIMRQIIDEGLDLSEQLTGLAKDGDWDGFSELEKRRQTVIRSLNVVDVDSADADNIREGLQQLVGLNQLLEQICIAERAELMKQITSLQQGKKAQQAYTG